MIAQEAWNDEYRSTTSIGTAKNTLATQTDILNKKQKHLGQFFFTVFIIFFTAVRASN